ncbi:FAD-dependent oxidoreductase [Candidatus Woesearchaeota archaeon]|nr:FAD-dependent oxidoreductase [Candidatus Woesearchaeota archaeon]
MVTAHVKKREVIAKDTIEVTIELEKSIVFLSGQHATIKLTLYHEDKKGGQRIFSITNTPKTDKQIIIAMRQTGSGFKKTLEEIEEDKELEVVTTGGEFTLPQDTNRKIVFIAGGIGITPFIAMLRHTFENNLPYKIVLVYSNKDKAASAYYDELQQMQTDHENFRLIPTMTSDNDWSGEARRIDSEFITDYFEKPRDYTFMIAGPPGLVQKIKTELSNSGAEQQHIITENFEGY